MNYYCKGFVDACTSAGIDKVAAVQMYKEAGGVDNAINFGRRLLGTTASVTGRGVNAVGAGFENLSRMAPEAGRAAGRVLERGAARGARAFGHMAGSAFETVGRHFPQLGYGASYALKGLSGITRNAGNAIRQLGESLLSGTRLRPAPINVGAAPVMSDGAAAIAAKLNKGFGSQGGSARSAVSRAKKSKMTAELKKRLFGTGAASVSDAELEGLIGSNPEIFGRIFG